MEAARDVYASGVERDDHRRSWPDVPEDVESDYLMEHLNDPNWDYSYAHSVRSRDFKSSKKMGYEGSDYDYESDMYSSSRPGSRLSTAIDFVDDSPYPEVRASVSNIDDPLMPVNTFRMWFLGIIFAMIVPGVNTTFSLRYPSVYLTGTVIQLISFPLGRGLAKVLPTRKFNTFGYVWSLNPGPFSIKEHVCITVMASVVTNGAYASDILLTQKVFFNQTIPFIYQICLCLGTQIIGFSWAGFLRKYVVWPSSMIWPGALVNAALFNTLHNNFNDKDTSRIRRERFFLIALACSFAYYWIPGFLFTGLSVFNWACWIAPNNVVVNTLFGTNSGLGMGILTFDWAMIAFVSNPLVSPWWSEANIAAAFVVLFWIICPILYFTNAFNSAYFPISGTTSFDNTGAEYNISAVVTADGFFDEVAYAAYSPVFMNITLALAYGIAFASITALVVHTFLYYRKDIVRRVSSTLKDEPDVHARLMLQYAEVPWVWYAAVGGIAFVLTIIAITVFPTQMPVWALIVGLVIACVLSLPAAMLQAITNQNLSTQVLHEMLAGYMLPGRPVANMIMKCVGYIGTSQAVTFSADLKLGHYMKVPPRIMFMCQTVAVFISIFVVCGVQNFVLNNVQDVCSSDQPNGFVCPSSTVFATSGLIWGGVGPARLFGSGAPYSGLYWFFLIGAALPIPFYFLARRFPLGAWRYINIPVCLAGLGYMPPASGVNYASWCLVGFIFNFVIRRYRFAWWSRYNYVLAAALDAGVIIAGVVMFFVLFYPFPNAAVHWWGNDFWMTTADALGTAFKTIGDTPIGPSTWS
jgi:OPT family small oligopeptide transporter